LVSTEKYKYKIKLNIITCMKVAGETNPPPLSGKWTVTGQNSGKLYTKKHQWGNSYF